MFRYVLKNQSRKLYIRNHIGYFCFKHGHTSQSCSSIRKANKKKKRSKPVTNKKGSKKVWVPKLKLSSSTSLS